jgi:glycerol-3-phosphate O-acyltransferase / dihydroxyacetone phosphate acyltransferase
MDKYLAQFLSEGKPAVKQLSRDIEEAIIKMTINAPDWLSFYSAHAAKDILFSDKTLVSDYVPVTQRYILIVDRSLDHYLFSNSPIFFSLQLDQLTA